MVLWGAHAINTTQAVLAALEACPKDADVQRWGCQALVPLFGDPVVAAPFRLAGVEAVIRALAVLQDVETALESMGAVGGVAGGWGIGGSSGRPKTTTAARDRWTRAMKKVGHGGFVVSTRGTPPPRPHRLRHSRQQAAPFDLAYLVVRAGPFEFV